jgi:hypothetical protein
MQAELCPSKLSTCCAYASGPTRAHCGHDSANASSWSAGQSILQPLLCRGGGTQHSLRHSGTHSQRQGSSLLSAHLSEQCMIHSAARVLPNRPGPGNGHKILTHMQAKCSSNEAEMLGRCILTDQPARDNGPDQHESHPCWPARLLQACCASQLCNQHLLKQPAQTLHAVLRQQWRAQPLGKTATHAAAAVRERHHQGPGREAFCKLWHRQRSAAAAWVHAAAGRRIWLVCVVLGLGQGDSHTHACRSAPASPRYCCRQTPDAYHMIRAEPQAGPGQTADVLQEQGLDARPCCCAAVEMPAAPPGRWKGLKQIAWKKSHLQAKGKKGKHPDGST